jgi:glucosamine-6-phosphate deaminase
MNIVIKETKQQLGQAAARCGADAIRQAIARRGQADIIVATGMSQFEMLEALAGEKDIPWHCVTGFHLDEYIGLAITHPASFRLYLWQRFVSRLPLPLRAFHFIDGQTDPQAECRRLGELIADRHVDVAFIGIGENGHLAFNDPPADFNRKDAFFVADLDEACRRQQLGEGWFPTLDTVPRQAISMSIAQILAAEKIVCAVPDARKAKAVAAAVKGPVTPLAPCSILQRHGDVNLFLDPPAAAGL